MSYRLQMVSLVTALAVGFVAITPVSAHEYRHHGGGPGPILGLLGAAVAVATLPVRLVGGAVSAATYAVPAQPVYYAPQPAYPAYAYAQPVYYAYPQPQPVYAYPQPVTYPYGQ